MYPFKIKINIRFYESSLFLKGVFAKNEKWYRLTAKNNRFCMLLILFLSVSSMRRKFKLLSVLLFQLFLSSSLSLVHVSFVFFLLKAYLVNSIEYYHCLRLLLILRTFFSFFHKKNYSNILFVFSFLLLVFFICFIFYFANNFLWSHNFFSRYFKLFLFSNSFFFLLFSLILLFFYFFSNNFHFLLGFRKFFIFYSFKLFLISVPISRHSHIMIFFIHYSHFPFSIFCLFLVNKFSIHVFSVSQFL